MPGRGNMYNDFTEAECDILCTLNSTKEHTKLRQKEVPIKLKYYHSGTNIKCTEWSYVKTGNTEAYKIHTVSLFQEDFL